MNYETVVSIRKKKYRKANLQVKCHHVYMHVYVDPRRMDLSDENI